MSAQFVRSVFLAYDLTDLAVVLSERENLQQGHPSLAVFDYDVRASFDGEASGHLQANIAARLADCEVLVCCVGSETWRNPWVEWELEYARVVQMPIVGWVIPGVEPRRFPSSLEGRSLSGCTLRSAVESLGAS